MAKAWEVAALAVAAMAKAWEVAALAVATA
jgi:hypothetical protein